MRYPQTRAQSGRLGAAAVELALLLPLLAFLFVIAVDYARIFYFTMVVTNCARSGAIYGYQDPAKANDQDGIKAAASIDAANLDSTKMTIASSTDSNTNPSYVVVTVSYPFTTISNFPGVASTTTISRSIRMNVTPLIPG
jgi:Flp pilus assembly protein TadG